MLPPILFLHCDPIHLLQPLDQYVFTSTTPVITLPNARHALIFFEPAERIYFAVDICQRVTPRAFLLLEQSVEPTDDGAARTGCTG